MMFTCSIVHVLFHMFRCMTVSGKVVDKNKSQQKRVTGETSLVYEVCLGLMESVGERAGESGGESGGESDGESDGIPGRKCRCQTLDLRIRDHTPPNRLKLCAFMLTRRGASDYDTSEPQNA